jgi:hypothetical protein
MKGRKLFPIIMAAAMLSLGSCGTDKNEEAIKFFKRGNFKLKEQEYNEAIHWYGEALNKNQILLIFITIEAWPTKKVISLRKR